MNKHLVKSVFVLMLTLLLAISFCFVSVVNVYGATKTLKSKNVSLSWTSKTVKFNKKGTDLVNQKPSVTVKYNGKKLKKGTDYTITYTDKYSTEAGDYYVKVKGKGKYKGTVTKHFKLNPIKATASNVKILMTDKPIEYTGKKIVPAASNLWLGYKDANMSDYFWFMITKDSPNYFKVVSGPTASKSDWTKTGKATISMKVKGGFNNGGFDIFSGTTTIKGTYVIYPSKFKITSATGGEGTITVKWNKPKGNFDSYRIYAYPYKGSTTYYDDIDNSKTSWTMTDLPAGKYTVCVAPILKDSEYADCASPFTSEKDVTVK